MSLWLELGAWAIAVGFLCLECAMWRADESPWLRLVRRAALVVCSSYYIYSTYAHVLEDATYIVPIVQIAEARRPVPPPTPDLSVGTPCSIGLTALEDLLLPPRP